ncbi:MAG: class I SAM-dependent methyltransferase [candidate division KSB1 bacterium]|nr:class I SAM-dependent methyltransferase [candidate division KSB1 bacterium]MDZ7378318.1 class I SAM-dependent methyltransferase [candidate division KSB1 bacterium]MDZ7385919.1 class I SAM-dependent methyltransferase [candidate division KSB1 bacterium]MDZ7392670.1 class I SAM-dependent methyltransferase [candidate division KSB1 bacterium]MDZ7412938.1 class I SAM-dependent methyltransferase [candidate division KSB1 bacterium]
MAEKHFYEQRAFAERYLVPFFQKHVPGFSQARVLEVGCAEAGFLDVLYGLGIQGVGLELSPARVALAKAKNPGLEVVIGDITEPACVNAVGDNFDLVVMRDVMEHVVDRVAAMQNVRRLLKTGGYFYVSFPPKYSPFAGHQQVGRSVLRLVPYLHLLPAPLLRRLGRLAGEAEYQIANIIANRRHGLSIASFERLCREHGLRPVVRELFLARPVYRVRFGIPCIRLPNLPGMRELLTLGYEALYRLT